MDRPDHRTESLRAALRAVAEEDVEDVLDHARGRARARAEKLLEDFLLEELLEAAGRRRVQAGSARPVTQESEDQGASDVAWWTYCVLPADEAASVPPELEGVEPGSTVEIVRDGELAALVSAVPSVEYGDERLRERLEDLDWVSRTARRHEAVLERVLEEATVVPLRLCTLYRSQNGVLRLLREHAAHLKSGLERVAGCTEWGVKVFAGEAAEEQDPADLRPDDEAEMSSERPGATYLLQRKHEREQAGRAHELRAACAESVHERISDCAREAISNPPQRPEVHGRDMPMVLNGAYLVANQRRRDLYAAISALQEEWQPRGFVIELTGPWPAYNFVAETAGIVP